MYSEVATDKTQIEYVLDNLCDDTVVELKAMYGDTYKQIVFEEILKTYSHLIKLKSTGEPVGLFGLIEQNSKCGNELLHNSRSRTAGIFLLTTDNLHKGNIILFLRRAKSQIQEWLNSYDLIMDRCYKKNLTIQKWLRLLGFKPSEFQDDDFQIYYKGNIRLYNE